MSSRTNNGSSWTNDGQKGSASVRIWNGSVYTAGDTRIWVGSSDPTSQTDFVAATDVWIDTSADVSAGQILGYTQYNPPAQVATPTSSGTHADLDATNLAVGFTVPPSGSVMIELEATVATVASNDLAWGVREGSTLIASSFVAGSVAIAAKLRVTLIVNGLTPGVVKTYKFSHARTTGAGSPSTAYGTTAGGAPNPATMKVTAL